MPNGCDDAIVVDVIDRVTTHHELMRSHRFREFLRESKILRAWFLPPFLAGVGMRVKAADDFLALVFAIRAEWITQ